MTDPVEDPQKQEENNEPASEEIPAPDDDAEEFTPQPELPVEQEPQPESARPGFFKRSLKFLFDPETRFGRGVRAVTRGLGLAVGFFALGFLLAYLLLYRPVSQAWESAQLEASSLQTQLANAEETLKTTQNDLQKTKDRFSIQQTRIAVLSILDHAQSARLALSARNGGETAKEAITATVKALNQALPAIKVHDAELSSMLESRLKLISSEAAKDPSTAVADLNIFIKALQLFDQNLAKK
ncbi:MAG: hypothetical protein IT308_00625 [Anaerolineaceae bacterium]|nr:hypothetical protein [Anaerolineaceae bacterium]